MTLYSMCHMLLKERRGGLGTSMSVPPDFEVELYGEQGAFVFTPGS